MADITKRFGLRHLRAVPTAHIRHLHGGRLAHEGTGLAFWFRPLAAAISEVPADDRELSLVCHARTAEFQDLAVQATLTYRITDPERAAARIDFSIAPDSGEWQGDPLDQLATLLTETAQQHALELIARTPLAAALADGVRTVRQAVSDGLAGDQRLAELGLAVLAVRITALRPEPEMERALRTPAREQVQQEADRATYGRRAVAVERERKIAENELTNRIELARQEEELVTRQGANARQEAEQQAAELAWFVREAWPSPVTGTTLVEGRCTAGEELALTVESDQLVAFGDGVESDALQLTWGQTVRLRVARERLRLVV
ncbi:hypothetical protein C7C46_13895 [Streptomyces tateyamensis]|uniref:Band 7 domain-containing protein n=1 Tax=Streptomyces tateyamensis TaxID=565073 RepID=A0A2V4NT62_9ACTN|nr:SPFH domain-containing protein [Streptomyces tateyamensis]PYC79456.1 hypothetical protein C7C46_13895 [Streptomyces tateyamensis]